MTNTNPSFHVTEKAAARIKQLLKTEGTSSMLRLAVRGGGCSGFSYEFSFDDQLTGDDRVFRAFETEVVIDDMSLEFVADSTLDFVDDLSGQYFKVENPHATASCGCGTSFSV